MKKSFVTVFSGLLILLPVMGQQWPFQHIDKKSGLSNSAITSVFMDKRNYVWFGSWDGLNRYDGTGMLVYKPEPAKQHTLSNNIIREIHQDSKGKLWFITHSGINEYDPRKNEFISYFDSTKLPFHEYNLKACMDPDSVLWISVDGWGAGYYDDRARNFKPYEITNFSSEWKQSIYAIGAFEGYVYLFFAPGKLVCLKDHRIINTLDLQTGNYGMARFIVLNEQYFLAVPDDKGNVDLYSLYPDEISHNKIAAGHSAVSSISQDALKRFVWLGTEDGHICKVIMTRDGIMTESLDSHMPVLFQKKLKILSVTETSQHIVWIGTDGDGVYKFQSKDPFFSSITTGPLRQGKLSQSIVRCIYEDGDNLYAGTRGGGLNIINTKDPRKSRVLNTENGLSNNAVLAVNRDHEGNIWIGIDGEGIDMLEHQTGKIYHFPADLNAAEKLRFSSVYAICIDSKDNIWLGTSGYGVIHLDVRKNMKGRYELLKSEKIDSKNSLLTSNIVYSILETAPGVFWFGTRFGGLYQYSSPEHRFVSIIKSGDNTGLSNNDVLSLCRDSRNILWIGTSGGLNRLDLNKAGYHITHYNQHDGLQNNTIHGILEDHAGRIWISTNEGLSLLQYEKGAFKNFNWNDGLQNNEFTDGAAHRSRHSGRLFFGGIDGLDIVNPMKLDTSGFFPAIAFTELQVHNVIIDAGDRTGILKDDIDYTRSIHLNHNQNFITLYFTALDFWNKQRCQYAYKLENYDKDWNFIDKQAFVNLVNLPPGKYVLDVRSTNENGTWNAAYRTLPIIISPPIWASVYAFFIYSILLILLASGIFLNIKKRLHQKRDAAIEKIRQKHERELTNYKLQFFTNIAHEFRTPLTLIMGPAAAILRKNPDQGLTRHLNTIYKNSFRLQKLIQELIEFRRIETGNTKLEVAEININQFVDGIVDIFQEYAVDRGLDLTFAPCAGTPKAFVDAGKLEKILVNLISNAIKYTPSPGKIAIKITINNGIATFEVEDTGVGISNDLIERIFDPFFHGSENFPEMQGIAKGTGIGLSLTKSLVEAHKGKIEVKSIPGQGSLFVFFIPVSREHYPVVVSPADQLIIRSRLKEKINTEFESSEYVPEGGNGSGTFTGREAQDKENRLLIVDDNREVLTMIRDIIPEQYDVKTAGSGQEALAILENEKIDLVISDVIMPGMDGLELCRKIRENLETSHIPVILLTARSEIEHRIEGLHSGADSYIPKPFHPEHLFIRIEKLLQSRELIRNKFRSLALNDEDKITHGLEKKEEAFLSRLAVFIRKEMSDTALDADRIASHMGMSKTALYKKIKGLTGLSPHLLINQYRLKQAAELLKKGEMNVSEIIYETGFNSRSYFYRTFNELFQCSPKDFGKTQSAG